MSSTLATPAVLTAVRALLVADVTLTSLLASGPAMYTDGDAPQQTGTTSVASLYPQLLLSVPSETPFNTMGSDADPKWGSSVLVGIKAITVSRNHDDGWAILNRLMTLLNGQRLTVSGYGSAGIELDGVPPAYPEIFAGLQYRHFPSLWRVYAHQS